jgi:exosortase H (IPTLxxWG-CTERM-specific)
LSGRAWSALKSFWQDNGPTVRFALLFGLGVWLVYNLLRQPAVSRALVVPFTESIARLSGLLISLLGTRVEVLHRVISGGGFSMSIENNCNAIFEIGFFLAAVVAYPATWRGKLWAFVIGVPLLYGINLVRVIGLFYIGARHPDLFDEAHLYVAQSLFILCIVLLWLAWVRRFGARPLELARVLD